MLKLILFPIVLLISGYGLTQIFTSSPNQLIPDDGTVITFPISVTSLPSVIDASFGLESICINMNHPYDSDMDVKLRAPDGTTVLLFAGIGGGDDNFIGTCLDGISAPIGSGTAPFTGSFKSMGTLGNLNNGQNPNGVWELICYDTYAFADQGFLIDFSLNFGSSPAEPFNFSSSVIPIVKLTTVSADLNNDYKVQVHMQIIDNGPGQINYVNQTNYAYEGDVMMEWQGFSGPSYPKKNYDFDLIDGSGQKVDTSLMGMPAENDWIFKAEYLDNSLLVNTITYEFARRMDVYAPRTRPCEIILDGNYIGYYTLTEKVKRDNNRLDIAKMTSADTSGSDLTGGYIIEMNINGDPGSWNSVYLPINSSTCGYPVEFKYVYPKIDSILPVQADYIKTYVDSFENAMNATSYLDPQWSYRNWIDVGSFIDFLIVNEFSMNYDSYGRSTYMYKEKDVDGGKLCIGPPWDYDRAMANDPVSGWVWENTHPYWPFPFWWSAMYSDTLYQHELACRWFSLREDVFKTENFMAFIDSVANVLYQGPGDRNFEIWQSLNYPTYEEEVEAKKTYLTARLNWMDAMLAPFGAVLPSVDLPTDTLVCAGTVFTAPYNASYHYNWIPGPETPEIILNEERIYNLKLTDQYGCYQVLDMSVHLSQPDSNFSVLNVSDNATYVFTGLDGILSSYTWNFGDATSTVSGMQAEHVFASAGNYAVELQVTDSLGCVATETKYLQIEDGAVVITFQPNPFQGDLTVLHNLPGDGVYTFELYDAQGRLIENWLSPASPLVVDGSKMSKGLYWLNVAYQGQETLYRVMKY